MASLACPSAQISAWPPSCIALHCIFAFASLACTTVLPMDVNDLTRQAVELYCSFFLPDDDCVFHGCVSPSINAMQCNGRAGGAGHRPGLRRGLHRPHGIGLPRSSRRRSPCHGVSIHRHLSAPLPIRLSGFLFARCFCLWWSLHAMALSGPGVCPSGRFVSRHQLTAPKRQPWLQKCQLYFVSQPAVGVWVLHRPLGERGQAMPIAFVSPKWKQLFGLLFERLVGSMLQMGG